MFEVEVKLIVEVPALNVRFVVKVNDQAVAAPLNVIVLAFKFKVLAVFPVPEKIDALTA